jgi:hypothetical protein
MAGTPVFGTSDILSLGADWEVISVSPGGGGEFAQATAVGNDGDICAHNLYDGVSASIGRYSGSVACIYKGAETNYTTALTNFWPGNYAANLMITGITIDYGPCAGGQRETVTFAVTRTSLTADSAKFASSFTTQLVTKQEGTGIPAILTKANADSEVTGCTYSITCQHASTLGADGNDIANAGATFGGMETVAQTYVGDPGSITLATPSGWLIRKNAITAAADKSNTGYDTYAAEGVHPVVRS